jgi:DNA-binding response OmpR family regulator
MIHTDQQPQPTILVIDDDPSALELIKVLLTPLNYRVVLANSGHEGMQLIKQISPDLILLDLLMPGMDGWQVCSEIRKFSLVPIIIISVIDSSEVITNTLNNGADGYLTKPVSTNGLTALIDNLLRRAETEKNAQLNQFTS